MSLQARRGGFRTDFLKVVYLMSAALLLALGSPRSAFAFPELTRHAYSNCATCHVNINGSGVLTQYGRSLSEEILSTFSKKGEGDFAFGTTPKWLQMGGDLRTLNIRQEQPSGAKIDRLILMQADIEAAATYKQWTIDATVGRLDTAIFPQGSDWISRRHYLLFRPEDEFAVQAGRFMLPYGTNTPDHWSYIREGLNFLDLGYNSETYNLEGAWLNETYNVFAAGSIGRPDDSSLNRDQGATVTGSIMAKDTIKTGASYYYGTNDQATRHIFGPWAIIGISSRSFILAEGDFQRNHPSNLTKALWGFADYVKADVEPFQGLHFFGTQEFLRTNFSALNTLKNRFGAGTQWFPRPHYEIEFMWQTEQNRAIDSSYRQILWLMLHFYP